MAMEKSRAEVKQNDKRATHGMRKFIPVPFTRVCINDHFWKPRRDINRKVTIPYEYRVCKETGRLDGYQQKDSLKPVHRDWMGDVGKWIEAAAYSLAGHSDSKLKTRVEDAIDRVIRGQSKDGYLYCGVLDPAKRLSNLRDNHEMYDAGHMMEAAAAYYEATGNRRLLEAMGRNADLLARLFGPNKGQKRGYCGHPEIELALVRMYRATGEKRYLDLVKFFIDERGRQPHYYDIESKARNEKPKRQPYRDFVAHMPVRKMTAADGHAVRALYLFCGMADLAMETNDVSLLKACKRLWKNITTRRMYVTGGAGSRRNWEDFTFDYDLPNETGYAETCANIALVFFAHRLLQIEADAQYADVMERALYNGVLSGIGLEGTKFFYANPLTVYPEALKGCAANISPIRQKWFGCSCCPPNVARLLASMGQYVSSQTNNEVYLHLYVKGHVDVDLLGHKVRLIQDTEYPWKESVRIVVQLDDALDFTLALRIPGWCRGAGIQLNGKTLPLARITQKGYAQIRRRWKPGDQVKLTLPMPVERIEANPQARMNCGKVTLQRGPLVYCLEEVDNGKNLAAIALPRNTNLKPRYDESLLGGVTVITGQAAHCSLENWNDTLYRPVGLSKFRTISLKAIPYCLRSNRRNGEMLVWVREI